MMGFFLVLRSLTQRCAAILLIAPVMIILASAQANADFVPLYRAYNGVADDHFYTISKPEIDRAVAQFGYQYEGIAATVFRTGGTNKVRLYRLYNPYLVDHFYTTNAAEAGRAIRAGYTNEGPPVAGLIYVWTTPAPHLRYPLYRLYRPSTGNHFYTICKPERDRAIIAFGYKDEGYEGYVYSYYPFTPCKRS